MSERSKSSIALWGLGGLMLAAALWQGVREAKGSSLLPTGSVAPSFSLKKFQGGTLNSDDLRGRVVMLDFWATWCGPCKAEMPMLHKLAQDYEPRGVSFVAADQDPPEAAQQRVQNFVTNTEPWLAPYVAMPDESVWLEYKSELLPTLYILDRRGQVVTARVGDTSEIILRDALDKALGQ